MADLSNLRVAVLATDGFEESELKEPVVTSRQPDDIPAFNWEMLNLFAQFTPTASGSR